MTLSNNRILRNLSKPKYYSLISLILLGIVTLYCAWYANYYLSGNSDDIVYPYLFQHPHLHDIILPGQHSNILKFPLFFLQGLLPYNFTTFTVINLGLVLITILAWAGILGWLFGRKYLPLICAALASLLLSSVLFNYDILGTTIRNIEYPIALGFIIWIGQVLQSKTLSRKQQIIGTILAVLFALTIAGDSFFFYVTSGALVVALGWLWYQELQVKKPKSRKASMPQFRAAALWVVGSVAVAFVVRVGIGALGLVKYYNAGVFKPHVLPISHLSPSLTTASTQLLDLFGANVFGLSPSPHHILTFLQALLLVTGLVGIGYMLLDYLKSPRREQLLGQIEPGKLLVFGAISITTVATFAAYVVSDLVVGDDAHGHIASLYQERYIAILPLLLIAGVGYLVWRKALWQRNTTIGLPILILAILLISAGSIRQGHVYDSSLRDGPIAVGKTAETNHVPVVLTGYWYGATTQFWSGQKVTAVSIATCNLPDPSFNNRLSWYKPSASVHRSALVVVRSGVDAIYWTCTDQQLLGIYGQPAQVINIAAPNNPQLWIYNYDLRTKLAPMTY